MEKSGPEDQTVGIVAATPIRAATVKQQRLLQLYWLNQLM